ncbi:hypothetical protein KUV89_14065 [Marinobacter hydrocarbonoclasticus]|nr:hypothetical protein [Marinobacter nauticus]
MYVHVHACRLAMPQATQSHFYINPLGELDVELAGRHCRLHGRFGELEFQPEPTGDWLLRCGQDWQLKLKSRDARSVQCLIEQAREEMEALMRDL